MPMVEVDSKLKFAPCRLKPASSSCRASLIIAFNMRPQAPFWSHYTMHENQAPLGYFDPLGLSKEWAHWSHPRVLKVAGTIAWARG